jgi:hypothetical protein
MTFAIINGILLTIWRIAVSRHSQLTHFKSSLFAGIFAVTVIGILIGLICRADVCGIKTKLCRTKKTTANRREPADTVSPFEEIPLNTVVNGKATEGQG